MVGTVGGKKHGNAWNPAVCEREAGTEGAAAGRPRRKAHILTIFVPMISIRASRNEKNNAHHLSRRWALRAMDRCMSSVPYSALFGSPAIQGRIDGRAARTRGFASPDYSGFAFIGVRLD